MSSNEAIIYDVPTKESGDSIVYDMPWEWTSGAHLRTSLTVVGDRNSLSSHDSSGSQNSVGSASSSSSVTRRRQFYETAFDSVTKSETIDDIDRKIQKHSNKVLVNIAPKERRKVTLLKTHDTSKPLPAQIFEVKATIEHNNSLGSRRSKIKKSKHHSFSDFDQLKRKIIQSSVVDDEFIPARASDGFRQRTFDMKSELKGMTNVMVQTALQDSDKKPDDDDANADLDYELPWNYNHMESQFKKLAIDSHICDSTKEPNPNQATDIDYDKPWEFNAAQLKFAFPDKRTNVGSDGPNANIDSQNRVSTNRDLITCLPANQMSIPVVPESTPASNTELKSTATLPANVNSLIGSSTGAVPKANKGLSCNFFCCVYRCLVIKNCFSLFSDICPPIIRPTMTLDLNQEPKRLRQNLNLNFGCSALSAMGEKIDLSIPLEQQG